MSASGRLVLGLAAVAVVATSLSSHPVPARADLPLAGDDAMQDPEEGGGAEATAGPEVPSDAAVTATVASDAAGQVDQDLDIPASTAHGIHPRIVGGSPVAISFAPWQVALVLASQSNDFDGQFCGGSIITSEWILTAAHCVVAGGVTLPASALRVLAGTAELSSTRSGAVAVRDIIVHPGYDPALTAYADDIALIRLAQPLRLRRRSVEAIALPDGLTAPGSAARITGWGSTWMADPSGRLYNVDGSPRYPRDLRGAEVTVQSDATCATELSRYSAEGYYFAARMLCAKAPAWMRDTCQGDSGGPLAIRSGRGWRLAGITSWGIGCAWLSSGIYTEVANYRSWIEESILLPGSVPTLSDPSPTADGFRIEVLDHDRDYRYDVAVVAGTGRVRVGRPSGGRLPITVSRVAPGAAVTIEVTSARSQHRTHRVTATATALRSGLRPVTSRVTSTATGFTFQVLNHSSSYEYSVRVGSGTATVELGEPSGGVLPVVVSGMGSRRRASVVITVERDGHRTESVTVRGRSSR